MNQTEEKNKRGPTSVTSSLGLPLFGQSLKNEGKPVSSPTGTPFSVALLHASVVGFTVRFQGP
jgi:hypothetical protein